MAFLEDILSRAQAAPARVAFSEGEDATLMAAAVQAVQAGIATPVLVGDAEKLQALAAERGYDPCTFEYVDVTDPELLDQVTERYLAQKTSPLGRKMLRSSLEDPLYLAMALLGLGEVDVAFAGIIASTGDVIFAGQVMVGLKEGIETPSSVAFFELDGQGWGEDGLLAFGDSAVCVNPTDSELASIAVSCCDTVADLMGWQPRCALISHSTLGSATNELTEKVTSATRLAQEARPDLAIDGEIQLDAALSPRVAERKVHRPSPVAGQANIVIWPNLDAGNIAVKCAQLFGQVNAYGPFLQGFDRIVCDCPRGASVEELVGNIAVSVVRAQAQEVS